MTYETANEMELELVVFTHYSKTEELRQLWLLTFGDSDLISQISILASNNCESMGFYFLLKINSINYKIHEYYKV